MNVNVNDILNKLTSLESSELNYYFFIIAAIIVVGLLINMIVGTYKGRDPYSIMIFDRIKDLFKYTCEELSGRFVQKINAVLSITLLLFGIVTFVAFMWKYLFAPIFDPLLFVLFFSFMFFFFLSMPFCAMFTRARY